MEYTLWMAKMYRPSSKYELDLGGQQDAADPKKDEALRAQEGLAEDTQQQPDISL